MMQTLHRGKYLTLVREGTWEWATRTKASGVVAVLAFTDRDDLILVEQHRPPVGRRVIELPAGLAGDLDDDPDEAFATAAARELEEEAGYQADHYEIVALLPSSAGSTDETTHLFRATGLRRVSDGGGTDSESIIVHLVPRAHIRRFLDEQIHENKLVDSKVYAALWWA